MDIVKLYFYFFLIIVLIRVALKWHDTTFLPVAPEIRINTPLSDGDFGVTNADRLTFTGVSGAKWSRISNSSLLVSNGSSVLMFQANGYEYWTNTVTLAPGTNVITPYTASYNGKSAMSATNTLVVYDPRARVARMQPSRPPVSRESLVPKGGVNPNLVYYFIMILTDLVALLGIFGYAYKKEIFSALFWKIFLPFFMILETYILAGAAGATNILVFIFVLTFILPAPYAIYLYGFTYHWTKKSTGSGETK